MIFVTFSVRGVAVFSKFYFGEIDKFTVVGLVVRALKFEIYGLKASESDRQGQNCDFSEDVSSPSNFETCFEILENLTVLQISNLNLK